MPDPRAINVAKSYGIDISQKKARIFLKADFDRFDRIYVMDVKNMNDVLELARNDKWQKKSGLSDEHHRARQQQNCSGSIFKWHRRLWQSL